MRKHGSICYQNTTNFEPCIHLCFGLPRLLLCGTISSVLSWSRIFTCPNHNSPVFLHLSVMFSTFSLSHQMSSFLTWSLIVCHHVPVYTSSFLTSSFFTWELVTDAVVPFMCGGILLSHRTPDIFIQLFHPHCVLFFTSAIISPSLCRMLPV